LGAFIRLPLPIFFAEEFIINKNWVHAKKDFRSSRGADLLKYQGFNIETNYSKFNPKSLVKTKQKNLPKFQTLKGLDFIRFKMLSQKLKANCQKQNLTL